MPTVAELMLHHADRVAPSATIGESAALMFSSQISSVIIVDHDKVLGIVTERDILHAMRQHCDASRCITTLMTSPVHTVSEMMDFREAYRSAALRGIRHLVVTDPQGKALGVVRLQRERTIARDADRDHVEAFTVDRGKHAAGGRARDRVFR